MRLQRLTGGPAPTARSAVFEQRHAAPVACGERRHAGDDPAASEDPHPGTSRARRHILVHPRRAPPTSPSIIGGCSDPEYGGIEYGGLPVSTDMPVPQCLSEYDNAAVRSQYRWQVAAVDLAVDGLAA
jgi:hypothetical protein